MKRLLIPLPLVGLLLLCGCFQVKDELTIQADGSGTVRLEVKTSGGANMMPFRGSGDDPILYPPTSAAEIRKFFPGKDFTVEVKEDEEPGGGSRLSATASFKNINALLNSPYAHAHALSLNIENGALLLKAVPGIEAAARAAEARTSNSAMAFMGGSAEGEGKQKDMRAEFRITLPHAPTSANGTRENSSVVWIAEQAKATNAGEFVGLAGKVLEASCPADGLKMTPATPPRLALGTFKDLADGKVASANSGPDAKKVADAARFVPYALHLTRTLDLSGDGGGRESEAQLSGAIVIPSELAPQKWGEAKLEEVLDPKGTSLKPRERSGFYGMSRSFRGDTDKDDAEEDKAAASEVRHPLTLTFLPPDWKTREITRIKGSVSLEYFGGFQVVKLSNAIPAGWIADQEKSRSFSFGSSAERIIKDPALTPLGLSIECQMAGIQNGMTSLYLGFKGSKSDVAELQVFDAEGKPWPTIRQGRESMGTSDEGETVMVYVVGQPKPPLSLALLLSSAGTSVDVPILLEHVPVSDK